MNQTPKTTFETLREAIENIIGHYMVGNYDAVDAITQITNLLPVREQTLWHRGMEMTVAQAQSLDRVIKHQGEEKLVQVYKDSLNDCLMAIFHHITIGIESDGYAHS